MSSMPAKTDAQPTSRLMSLSAKYELPRPTEAFCTTKDGARLRYAHWRTAASTRRGSLLFLNGRTEFIEKAIEAYTAFVASGLDLWTLDWRGQGLSEHCLADPHKGHIEDYQVYLDDLDHVVREIANLAGSDGKMLLLGHSMGGHIGLRYLHDHPGLFDAAVLLAPMIDISVNRPSLRGLNRMFKQLGLGETYALGTGRFKPIFENPDDPSDNGTLEDYRALLPRYKGLSQDPKMRAETERYVRDNPALASGGPTCTWLDATFRSINASLAPGYPEAIDTPVLLISGGRDRTVLASQQERIAARLRNGAFQSIDEGAHELLMEEPTIRQKVYDAFSAWTGVEINAEGDGIRSA